MASNDFAMNKISEGSTGTGGRVDELMFPVDISHQSRSEQAHANENFSAVFSGGSSEDDELVHPVSESRSDVEVEGQRRVTILEPIREENEDVDDGGRTHQPVRDPENTDHSFTVEESDRICRACGPDEEITEDPDNLLVELGCKCRGDLCRMHRKCILVWYGPRMCQENNYKCELCNGLLHGRIEHIVFRALIGRDTGNYILMKALGNRSPRSRRIRRIENDDDAAPTHANAHPDSHQIDIVETVPHPGSRQPRHPIWDSAQSSMQFDRPYYRSTREGPTYWCVVVFIIMVLIGLGVTAVGHKLH